MSPQNVTTKQLVGSMTVPHWVAAITVASTVTAALCGGGFWVGKALSDSQAAVQLSKSEGTIALQTAKLEMAQQKIALLESSRGESQQSLVRMQELLNQRNAEVVKLNAELGRANNCTFIQQQIELTRVEMERPQDTIVYFAGKEWEEKQKARKAILEKRLEGFMQQLGGCNK